MALDKLDQGQFQTFVQAPPKQGGLTIAFLPQMQRIGLLWRLQAVEHSLLWIDIGRLLVSVLPKISKEESSEVER